MSDGDRPAREPLAVFISAGEPSGDAIAVGLLRALVAHRGAVDARGIGGPTLLAAGLHPVATLPRGLLGLTEVVGVLPAARAALAQCDEALAAAPPAVVVLVDYAGFNLRLAERAARRGIPVVYLVPPKVWAWGRGRLATLRRCVRQALCILPFEAAVLEGAGVPARYIGHPVADRIPAPGARAVDLAVLPGSRLQEIRRHLPALLATTRRLMDTRPELRVVMSAAEPAARRAIEGILEATGTALPLSDAPGIEVLASARVALVSSGTATLEAAVVGTPMVVVYRVAPGTALLARWLLRGLRFVALPNLLAGREVAREHLQRLEPAALAADVGRLLDEGPAREAAVADLAAVTRSLGLTPGVLDRAAQEVLKVVEGGRKP